MLVERFGIVAVIFASLALGGSGVVLFDCSKTNQRCEKSDSGSMTLEECRSICYGDIRATLVPYPTGVVEISKKWAVTKGKNWQSELNLKDKELKKLVGKVMERCQNVVKNKLEHNEGHLRAAGGEAIKAVVYVNIETPDLTFNQDTDESYKFFISVTGKKMNITINAKTFYGARHAGETLLNLVVPDKEKKFILIPEEVRIEDNPAFRYRALSIETGNNFLPMNTMELILEGMALSKLNVLQWKINDASAFSMEIPQLKELANYGALDKTRTYSANQITDLVEFAKVRGITIIPELQVPAHSQAGLNQKGITLDCDYVDPTKDETYDVISKIYESLDEMFEKPFLFHIGGDNVKLDCWNKVDHVKEWLGLQNSTTVKFYEKLIASTKSVLGEDRLLTRWRSSDLENDVYENKNIVLEETQSSKKPEVYKKVLKDGYNIIIANKDAFDLDSNKINWRKVYSNSLDKLGNDNMGQVWGGVAYITTKTDDSNTIIQSLFPRASALAERLWTNPKDKNYNRITTRLATNRIHLYQNGVKGGMVQSTYCLESDNCSEK